MKKKHLITSALPYINGIKHLGNLVGSMLPADVYARYLRQCGEDVLYICGTDEHGTPAEIAAREAGKSVNDYCLDMYQIQKNIYEKFQIQFDYFGRSSASSNHALTQEMFIHMKDLGFIEEKEIQLYYSPEDGRFLPDRYVEGTCPHCSYEKARGDQCDGCGTLLDPTDLKNPYSSLSGSKSLELRKTKHLFLLLDHLTDNLESWINQQSQWPDVVKGIAKKWLKEGLKPRCITRDLKWGIRIPLEGYDEKVFYVWFDAPNAYISMTQDWAMNNQAPNEWKEWWLPHTPEAIQYTQFMAKDNVPFHAIFWPAMLMASGQPWKQVDYIKGVNWLTYEKGKFSTSNKRGIFTDTALELFPADYWRYYLMANCPEGADADFTFSHFASVINKDLADVLGNFANRSFALLHKYFDGKIPLNLTEKNLDQSLLSQATELVTKIKENLDQMKFRQAVSHLRSLWVLGNEYITEQKPWETIKTNPDSAATCLTHCIYMLRLYAYTSSCIIPETADKILKLIGLTEENAEKTDISLGLIFTNLPEGHSLQPPQRLFAKIEDTAVQELTQKYQGA